MTRDPWFLAVKNEHGGQLRAFLITGQLNGDQVQHLAKALEREDPTRRVLPKREAELDAVVRLQWRKQCRDAEALQRSWPQTGRAQRREPSWKSEIREIRATADRMIADMVAGAADLGTATPGAGSSPRGASPVDPNAREPQTVAAVDDDGTRSDAERFTPTPADRNILQSLAEASTTLIQADIEQASGEPIRIVKERLPLLETARLVNRPHGDRKGYAITNAGRDLLAEPPVR